MNFHLYHRICLPGTLITAIAVGSLKAAEGNQLFQGAPFIQCASCRKYSEGHESSFAVRGQKGPGLGRGANPSGRPETT